MDYLTLEDLSRASHNFGLCNVKARGLAVSILLNSLNTYAEVIYPPFIQ